MDRMYNTIIREYNDNDLQEMIDIWNEVVEEGIAFPQEDCLDLISGRDFFASQTCTSDWVLSSWGLSPVVLEWLTDIMKTFVRIITNYSYL